MKVAVIGAGLWGLASACRLHNHAHVTVFEACSYFFWHANALDVTLPDVEGLNSRVWKMQ